jgi:23S rRNA pseudouridine2605 synthase
MIVIDIMTLLFCSTVVNGVRLAAFATLPLRAAMSFTFTEAYSSTLHRPHSLASILNNIYKLNNHYVSTLRRASVIDGDDAPTSDDGHESITAATSTKQKSRKQRKKIVDDMNLQRIDKVLAHRGVGSRSQTFELAKAKRITWATNIHAPHSERIRIRGPKEKVPFEAALFIDGNLLPGPPPLLLVYHKPKYVLSVMEDDKKYLDQERKHLGNVLEERYKKAGMHPVGRLDYDTTGLLLFSLDGKLTQQLLHPRRGVEKEYVATVQGQADEVTLKQKLLDGVETTEGVHTAKLIGVGVSPYGGPAEEVAKQSIIELDEDIDDGDDEKFPKDYSGPYSDVRLVVSEGKYRMVRRMLANCGFPVVELRRLRHGQVELGDLKVGEFRQATEEEIQWAKSLID